MSIKPKERVLLSFKNQIPDRVPVFVNVTPVIAQKLSALLDIPCKTADSILSERISFNDILVELGNDVICVGAERSSKYPTHYIEDGILKDEWGLVYQEIGPYKEVIKRPLENIESIKDLQNYSFPSANSPGRFALAEKDIKKYGQNYAVMGTVETTIFEMAWGLVGFEKFLMDLISGKLYTFELLDRIKEYSISCGKKLIELGAEIIWPGDDFGTQQGMLISPDMWREIFKPRYKEVFSEYKKANPEVLIAYHSCGSIRPIIEDLIEIGMDILNPIQPKALDMNISELKELYGNDISFFGGIDIQELLPNGTPVKVRETTGKLIKTAGKNGGFLLGPAHHIQADTPLENVYAIFQAVKKYGYYPL